jgi:hypothetical protein
MQPNSADLREAVPLPRLQELPVLHGGDGAESIDSKTFKSPSSESISIVVLDRFPAIGVIKASENQQTPWISTDEVEWVEWTG